MSDVGLLGSGVGGDAVGEGGLLMSMLTEHTCASDSDEVFEFAPPASTSSSTTAIYYTRPVDEWRLVAGAQVYMYALTASALICLRLNRALIKS